MKTQNNILYFELVLMACDVTYSKLKRDGRNTGDKKLSVEHILNNMKKCKIYKLFLINYYH